MLYFKSNQSHQIDDIAISGIAYYQGYVNFKRRTNTPTCSTTPPGIGTTMSPG